MDPAQELEFLKSQAGAMGEQLDEIEKRIRELESEE
jgi:hypothetical protein